MSALLADVWTDAARAVLPLAPPLSYVDFAATLILPDGKNRNRAYHPESHPAQLVILQAMDGGTYFAPQPYREIAVAKPVQDGGTLVTLVPLLRRVISQRQSALLSFPTLDSAKDVWTTKVIPVLAAYGGQEPESGGGSRGGAARVITLPNGGRFFLRAAGGRGESQQASVTGDAICVDEVDDWPDLHRIELIGKRIEESPDPLLLLVCTVKRSSGSLILSAVAEGTDSRLHYACPDCGGYQPLEWENVVYERSGQSCIGGSARVACIHCGSAWDEAKRLQALSRYLVVHRGQEIKDGAVIGPIPDTPRFSLRWTRLESPRKTLHSLCASHARALYHVEQGDHGPMKSFWQDYMTAGYTGDLEELEARVELTWQSLLGKSQTCKWGPCLHTTDKTEADGQLYSRHVTAPPAEASFACGGVDVQNNRVYLSMVASALDGTAWDVGWSYEYARRDHNPWEKGELFALLDRCDALLRSWAGPLEVPYLGLDTGDWTDELYEWVASKRGGPWRSTKGASRAMKDEPGDIEGTLHIRDGLYHIDTDTTRELVQSAYRRPNGTMGAAHLPRGLGNNGSDSAFLKHLCAEQRVYDHKTKKERVRQGPGRWDWLDARRIAEAMIRLHLARRNRVPPRRKYGAISSFGA